MPLVPLLPPALHVPSLTWRASMPPLSLPTTYLSLSDFWQSCQLDAEREKKQGSCTCSLLLCLHSAAEGWALAQPAMKMNALYAASPPRLPWYLPRSACLHSKPSSAATFCPCEQA